MLWNNKFDCLVMKVFVLLKGMYNWLDVSFIRINFVFDIKCNDVRMIMVVVGYVV